MSIVRWRIVMDKTTRESTKVDPISNTEYKIMDGHKQFIVKLELGSSSFRVWDFEEIPCAHALFVLRMLNLDTCSYVADFYYRRTLSATYKCCARPVEVHLDWRAKDDVMKVLPSIVKRQVGRPEKQRIPYVVSSLFNRTEEVQKLSIDIRQVIDTKTSCDRHR
ncbi:uncharacterized protein LOC120089079 [Benincasa hispida]|uniref:uncharacterized protein LOC120089079 n=1 Tax=Benincasa hispida TaxID=102211 RepID=UPI001902068E|nr:uncharacterized protein LOC120089079 [Benincasa hispida]